MSRILYVSYDGMLEPLGQSQVLPYLRGLAPAHYIVLMSFEKPRDLRERAHIAALARELRQARIDWVRLLYHRRPTMPATAYDVLRGILAGWRLCRAHRIEIVHARGYVPGVIAWWLKRLTGAKFLFDMRGFWPEEKADAGHWRRDGLPYRLAKRWERILCQSADGLVSLTRAGLEALPKLGLSLGRATATAVIPTCADLTRFAPGPKDPALVAHYHLKRRFVLGCVGTLSGWYLRRETLEVLAGLLRQWDDAAVLMVTHEDHRALRRDAEAAGIAPDRLVLTSAGFADMPAHIRLMDLGVFLIMPTMAKRASAPTKLAEFLGCGMPVLINDGVGDSGGIVRASRVGVVLAEPTAVQAARQIEELRALLADPALAQRCRETARQRFDLPEAVSEYHRLYARMLGHDTVEDHPTSPADGPRRRTLAVSATAATTRSGR